MTNTQTITLEQLINPNDNPGGLPQLHSANVSPSSSYVNVHNAVAITAECISSLYASLFLLGKPFADHLNENFPETCIVYQNTIMNEFVPQFAKRYPDFTQFDVKVKVNGALEGQNTFTNTVLQFMLNLAAAPMDAVGNKVNPDLIYSPSLGHAVWLDEDLGGYIDHDSEEDGEYDDDYS